MKKFLCSKILCTIMAFAVLIQYMQSFAITLDSELPAYRKAADFSAANGTQGYNGWYYMFKPVNSSTYSELPWNGKQFTNGNNLVEARVINPAWKSPTAIVWKAPYTGVITLGLAEPMQRSAADPNHSGCGDITATILHNGAQLKQNDGTDAQWVFDNATKGAASNKTYDIKDISVQKGDLIYFEVDCGVYNAYITICWSPIISYTSIDSVSLLEGSGTEDDPYLIGTEEDLQNFAYIVNNINNEVCAKLTADVVAESGKELLVTYSGTFNGNNHKITLNGSPLIETAKGEVTIRSLMLDGNVSGSAAFVGSTENAEGSFDKLTIENSANVAVVNANSDYAAGFVGYVNDGDTINMTNCYNYGSVAGGANSVPLAYTAEKAMAYYNNCYYLKGSAAVNPSNAEAKTAEEFASGEVAYNLGSVFGQRLTVPKDDYPVFRASGNAVYLKDGVYGNDVVYPKFKMAVDYPSDGTQGKNSWYYMYEENGQYCQMDWNPDGSAEWKAFKRISGNNVANFIDTTGIMPGVSVPSVIAWRTPLAGTVNLSHEGSVVKRSANSNAGNVTVSVLHNDSSLWEKTLPYDAVSGSGKEASYNLSVSVKCGDMIYFKLACGSNPTAADVFWRPEIEYTEVSCGTGSGLESDPYIISTTEDLKTFGGVSSYINSNAYAVLVNDIVCTDSSDLIESCSGTIDGNGHKIILSGGALISTAKDGLVIKNLMVDGTADGTEKMGAFVRCTDSARSTADNILIENCANLASVTVTEGSAAGIVGYVYVGDSLEIRNSYNFGNVVSVKGGASPLACSADSEAIRFENCFYLEDSAKANNTTIQNPSTSTMKTAEEFASGEVAYLINKGAGKLVYGQTVGVDNYPVFIQDNNMVCQSADGYGVDGAFVAVNKSSVTVAANESATAFIAQYDGDSLASVKRANVGNGDVRTVNLNSAENADRCKVFVWNDLNHQSPVCEVSVYEPPYLENITTTFDDREYNYPILLVDEYPSMEIGDLASVIGGRAYANTLTVGDVTLTYTENSRLAVYGDGHIMLERSPRVVDGKLYVPISSLIPTTGWTVEYKRFENRIVIETGTNYPEPEMTVYVKDYGAVGDGEEDDKEAILAAFNAAAGSGRPVKLEFEEGKTYRVSEKQDAFALFDLDNISNFTLEGNNSTILFERPTNSLVNIDGSTNIKFNNINVDYEEPVTIWGRVTSIDSNDGSFIMEIPEGSPLPPDDEWAIYWNPVGDGPYAFGQFMDANEDRLKFLTFDHLWINSITHVSGKEYKVTHNYKYYMPQVEIGDRFVYKSRWTAYDFGEFDKYGRPCFLTVTNSKDVTFDGVKTNGSLLMFAPVSYNDGRIIFRNCELVLKPGTLITTNADGVHAVSNRFGVIIENCIFRNSLDDFINTNQYSGNVTRIIDDYTFEVDREIFYRVGDEIRFFDKTNHKVIDSGFLKSVKSTGAGKYILTIDRPIKSVVSSETSESATLVYNMSASNNGDIIKNNKFYNSRRHVCLLRSANALFENNYMENNGGAAVEAANSIYQNTNEGLHPSALTMRGNTYKGDGITSVNNPIKVFSANAQIGEQAAIDGVLIENNTIDVPSIEGAIKIRDVSGLYMLNNTVKCGDKLKDTAVPVLIENSTVKAFDGLKYDVADGTSVVVKLMSCDVEEDNINNINSIGVNTTEPYIMEKKNIINK